MLRDIDEAGRAYEVTELPYLAQFQRQVWGRLTERERGAIVRAINDRLDDLVAGENASGQGALTNTSLEGGRRNPFTGEPGDWEGTPFRALFDLSGNPDTAKLAFGNAWKMVIIARPERWVGIRADPTFPGTGVTLEGKTYFLAR